MIKLPSNHEFEQQIADLFLQKKFDGQMPNWKIIQNQPNGEPDFEFTLQGKKIGVEIKRLFHATRSGSPPRARDSRSAELCNLIEEKILKSQSRGLYIDFSNPFVQREERYKFIFQLVEIIEKYRNDPTVDTVEILSKKLPFDREGATAFEVNQFISQYVIDLEYCGLTVDSVFPGGDSRAGEIKEVTYSQIQDQINKISRNKFKGYDEIWLLITWEDSLPSAWYYCDDHQLGSFESDFDEIYIFDPGRDIIRQLQNTKSTQT